jgi:AraC-like DNA-binding protein
MNLTNLLFALIIFQLLFLSLFLFTRENGRRISNILLGSFFLTISLNLLDVFLLYMGTYSSIPQLAGWGSCLPLLFGPLIFFYTRSVLFRDSPVNKKSWLHLLPFLIIGACTEYFYLSQPRSKQEEILSGLSQHHLPGIITIVSSLIFAQFLLYVISSLRLISNYKKASGQYFSDSRSQELSWLYGMMIFLIIIIFISVLNGIFVQTALAKYYLIIFNIVILAMLIYVIMILMKALRSPYQFPFSREEFVQTQAPLSSKTNQLNKEINEAEKIAQDLIQFMQSKKPYLQPELTLDQLAAQLSLKPRLLSQVINRILGQSFFDFVNHYRIEEASRLLTNPKDKKITILEVLYEVGFNSKSSFNTIFKKYTGLTPTEFRKKNLL